MLRGSPDVKSINEYDKFIDLIVAKINRQCNTRFEEEKYHLQQRPSLRTNEFGELLVKVTRQYYLVLHASLISMLLQNEKCVYTYVTSKCFVRLEISFLQTSLHQITK